MKSNLFPGLKNLVSMVVENKDPYRDDVSAASDDVVKLFTDTVLPILELGLTSDVSKWQAGDLYGLAADDLDSAREIFNMITGWDIPVKLVQICVKHQDIYAELKRKLIALESDFKAAMDKCSDREHVNQLDLLSRQVMLSIIPTHLHNVPEDTGAELQKLHDQLHAA